MKHIVTSDFDRVQVFRVDGSDNEILVSAFDLKNVAIGEIDEFIRRLGEIIVADDPNLRAHFGL